MCRLQPPSRRPQACDCRRDASSRSGFTLVELLVVVIILTVLASLSLAGLLGARQRAKADKTRSTIRKIDAVIRPMFDGYRTRRALASTVSGVPTPTSGQCPNCYSGSSPKPMSISAWKMLVAKRRMMTEEMPDGWGDVYSNDSLVPADSTAAARRYARLEQTVAARSSAYANTYGDAESLWMITMVGGFEPEAAESFRPDELGDVDRDSAPEFLDGWGRPIRFIRWPAGFASTLISASVPDPLDVARVTGDWSLVPLIVSAGPDAATSDSLDTVGGFGIVLPSQSWLGNTLALTYGNVSSTCGGNTMGSTSDSAAAIDNITNHDLIKK